MPEIVALYPLLIILVVAHENAKPENANDMSLSQSIRFASVQAASSEAQNSVEESRADCLAANVDNGSQGEIIETEQQCQPETFDAFVPSTITDLLSRANFKARYIPLSSLRSIDFEKQFKPSYDLMQTVDSDAVVNHCLRCYYFSLLILHSGFPSNTPGVRQITREELFKRVFLTSILHDVALSHHESILNHPAHGMSFELQSGIMAYEHLLEKYLGPSLSSSDVGDVVQGIMLHTTQFSNGTSSTANILITISAYFDLSGYGAWNPGVLDNVLHRDSVKEIEAAFPRGNVGGEFVHDLTEMLEEKPNCSICRVPPSFFEKVKAVKTLADSH
ncbi:hypothetical protein K435DRAFT_850852 [Dendrothele bispora CBS 962.96]|uniref:HD domain-containing protein n=1 Tax=Dendrothele bispora (strain CBS 962.96) TaxID=1314807 RepID=A0A4S8MN74_DENBC|nr:hypothetical protein K435DRAFT_850852 [Dendrothele bispora CBS 962.96]